MSIKVRGREYKATSLTAPAAIAMAFAEANDFLTVPQIVAMFPELRAYHVQNALVVLRDRYQAYDALVQDGTLFWYPTPSTDQRMRTLKERRPEEKQRKTFTRKRRKV